MIKEKKNLLAREGVQTFLSSLLCIALGLIIGFIALLIINPAGAGTAIVTVLKNYLYYNKAPLIIKNLGNTLVKVSPLLMCSLSVLFAYKAGLFNIGAAGQYVVGAGASLYFALALQMPWYVCLIAAIAAGALWGAMVGLLKSYCNVNEVISGIMLNWIGLYLVNMILSSVKDPASPYTLGLAKNAPDAVLPSLGIDALLNNNRATIAIPLAVIIAVVVWVILDKTAFGYELKATGLNKNAAKYAGMKEKKNIIVTMMISGALAACGAAFLYLTGFEEWSCTQTSVPSMGFNGIAAAFLGGLNPLGTVFASYFIEHITDGGSFVDKTMYCAQISDFISAVIIYLCGFVLFFKLTMNNYLTRRAEKAAARQNPGKEADAE